MKREILFRGKTKSKNSKWITGDLNNVYGGMFIFDRIDESELNSPDNYEVIPETVGQFTELTDKDGNKIFEGDVLKREYFHTTTGKVIGFDIVYVVYGKDQFKFIWKDESSSGIYWLLSGFIIIGNIYDNPELLKTEK